ncbi:MAG TPA: hypothetical protein VNV88_04260 [Candidatus Solibacter sp.]|nr:hypothetical protein [Candidatus Solibacter sp.]
MVRKSLFAIVLSTSLALFGQVVSNGTSFPVSVPPGPGLQGTTWYVSGIAGNGQLAASSVTFASPPPTAGISEAGFTGISDHAPIPQGVQSTLAPSTVVYTSAPPTLYYGGAPYGGEASMNSPVSSEANSTETSNNLGPSFYAGTINGSNDASSLNAAAPPLSLGEVAVQNKARAHSARTYTNADLHQLIGRNVSGNVMVAVNRTPSGVPASAQNAQQSTANAAQSQNPSSATATNSGQQSAAAPNAGAGQTSSAQNAENTSGANAGTMPQTRQRQSGDSQAMNRLPATSTILPLLGLIGLATSGAGLWYKRSRR